MFKLICFCLISSVLIGSSIGLPQQQFQPQPTSGQLQAGPQVSGPGPQEAAGGPPQPPQISWGKCPQLEPKESEKKVKAEIISNCLKSITLPENITQESVEKHRTEVARCALNAENWFTADGKYRYEKAETEIKNKKLTPDVEVRESIKLTQSIHEFTQILTHSNQLIALIYHLWLISRGNVINVCCLD